MNTGLAGFHAVYPRASHVARNPPDGKLEASGSLWISCAAENASIAWPFSSNERNASCFSAVSPVCGWNQCVKCVAPLLVAHSLMTCATAGAIAASSFFPSRMEATRLSKTKRGSLSRICRAPKVLQPKNDEVALGARPFASGWCPAAVAVRGRAAMSCSAVRRGDDVETAMARDELRGG